MVKKAEKVLKRIVGQLKKETLGFTTDLWTSCTGDSYISFTLHYIHRLVDYCLQHLTFRKQIYGS